MFFAKEYRYQSSFLIALLFTCHFTSFAQTTGAQTGPNKGPTKIPLEDRMDLAIAHEVEITKDPALGYVPRERLLDAQAYLKSLQQQQQRSPIANVAWVERGPNNIAGRTRALLIDANDATGNTVWAGGVSGGLWKTTDISVATPAWTAVDDQFSNLAVCTIVQDPVNAQIMYFGTGEGWFNFDAVRGMGIWKSTNGGATWSMLAATNNSTFYYVQKMVVASNGDVFATTRDGGVQRSQNGGTTWTKVLGSGVTATTNRAADIEIATDGSLYATMGIFSLDGIYKSTNGGTTWTKLTGGLPTTNYARIEIACAPSNGNRLYALYQNAATNGCLGIYTTTDGGANWTAVTTPNFAGAQAWYDFIAGVDPNNESRLFVGGVTLFGSTNAGSTWNSVSIGHTDHHGIFFKNGSSSIAYFTNDGGIYRTTNANVTSPTLSFRGKNFNVTQYYAADLNPNSGSNEFLAGTQDNGSHRFTSSGINTVTTVTGGDGGFCHIDQGQPNIQITAYIYNQYWITNNSWGTNTFYNVSSNKGSFINPTDYDDANNILYCCYEGGKYLRISGVGGALTVDTIAIPQFNGASISTIKVSPNTAHRVFFGLSNGDVVRVDNANTSTPTATIIRDVTSSANTSSIAVQAGNDNHILMCYSNYGVNSVWETLNGGTNWTSVEGNLPDMPIRWVLFSPSSTDQALVATELGVWTTDDLNGTSTVWGASNSGLANVRTDMLQSRSSDKLVIAATHGRGVFSSTSFGTPIPLLVTPSNQNVSDAAGSTTFSVATNLSWTVTDNQPWLTVTPSSGTNNGTLTATFTNNPDNTIRVGTITVSASGNTSLVTVTQAGIPIPCTNSNEPANNTCSSSAPVIPFSTDFPSQIGSTTDNDYYKFTLSSAADVQIQLFNLPFDYDLTLLNSACATLATSDNGNTTNELITLPLSAGVYYVKVIGWNGAFSTTECYTLNVTPTFAFSATATATPVTCFGGSNGAISVVASGGTAPYTYLWSNGQTAATAVNLTAGTYTVIVSDLLGTTLTLSSIVSQPSALTSDSTVVNIVCNGGSNGSVTLHVSGGTMPYSYLWNNGQTTATAINLVAGTYTAVITDNQGCTATKQAVVAQPAALVIGKTIANVLCNGGSNGSIALSVSGGTTPYGYLWSNGATTATANGLVAGTYTVVVTDGAGCMLSTTATVVQPAALVIGKTIANVSCNGDSNGSIELSVSGGTTPYSYLWSNGPTTATANGLVAGAYTVVVTDGAGCMLSTTATVLQPAALVVGKSISNVSCNGDSNGSIALDVSGGTTSYGYLWSNGATTATSNGLVAGTYTVVVTDGAGCMLSTTATVVQPAALIADQSISNISCNGGSNGSIALNVSGGTAPYNYLWNNGATTATANGLTAGTYTVVLTDAAGCIASASATVVQPTVLALVATIANVSCNGGSNGSVALGVSGGTAPYSYLWSNGSTTAAVTEFAAGTFTVVVTDGAGCTGSVSEAVLQPAALEIGKFISNISCNGSLDGSIALSIVGGTAPYNYLWSNGLTASIANGLAAGTYTVVVTDGAGCIGSVSGTVLQPAALALGTSISNVSCNGGSNGSIELNISGGTAPYSYVWSNGLITPTNTGLAGGTYTVVVKDAAGCVATTSATVVQPNVLTVGTSITNVSCNSGSNGSIALNISGGTAPYGYVWSNGATTATAGELVAGTYTVVVKDSAGCVASASETVVQPDALTVGTSISNVSCNNGSNGSIALNVLGGTAPYNYLWSNGATIATTDGLTAGTYTVVLTDAAGCVASASATVIQPTALAISTSISNISCNGGSNGSIALDVSGGTTPYSYLWSNGSINTTANGLAAGTYTVVLTDAAGCIATTSATIVQPTVLAVSPSSSNVSCNGSSNGSIALDISGGTAPYSYLWSNGATTSTAIGLTAGTYSVVLTDAAGCVGSASATIVQPTALALGTSISNVLCNGGSNGAITLNASGGTLPYTYLWSNGAITATVNGLTAGSYTVVLTDQNGCSDARSATVTEPASIVLEATVFAASCNGGNNGAITLMVNGGVPPFTYLWSNGQTTPAATGLVVGTYSVVLTDAQGCSASNTSTVQAGAAGQLSTAEVKVILQGPYVSAVQLMHDSLRVKNLIPLEEPYTGLTNFTQIGGGGEQTTPAVLATAGPNAIVDWVFLELRSAVNPALVLATRSALLQRDGDVVDVDGVLPVRFQVPANTAYFIAVRHRNHLGAQTGAALNFPACEPVTTDFTSLPPEGFYSLNSLNPAQKLVGGHYVLWAGNGRVDFQLKYNGSNNDRTAILSDVGLNTPNAVVPGYNLADYNLDGVVKYNGSANDRNVLLGNVGITTPSAIVNDQTGR